MRLSLPLLLAGVCVTLLAGCGSARKVPDELAISRAAPLAVPPDFQLRPPRPGEPRPQEVDSQGQAIEALFGPGVPAPPPSQGESALLDQAGATSASADIRSTLADDGTRVVDKGALLKQLLDTPPGDSDPAIATTALASAPGQ